MPNTYDEDDFDSRGILKDGRSIRTSVLLMDDDAKEKTLLADHAPLHVVDAFGNDGFALNRPGARYAAAGTKTADHARLVTAKIMCDRARAEWINDTVNAWRSDAAGDAKEGDVCTVRSGASRGWTEGSPGHLKMINGQLECVPDKNQDGVDPRDAAYHAMVDELVNAWRPKP
jgi:hypothetical protein